LKREPKKEEPGGEAGAPLWMVSFTDAMTNLLTFFILLVTFAAFGDAEPSRMQGAGPGTADHAVHSVKKVPKTGAVAPGPQDPGQKPHEGSEKPTDSEPLSEVGRPRAPIGILDTEAYADHKIIVLPSKYLFYGWGSFLTEAGQTRLAQIAPFLRAVPCQVVIGESSAQHQNNRLFNRAHLGPERASSVVRYLTEKEHLDSSRFSVTAVTSSTDPDLAAEPIVEIVLLSRRVYP
jgi:chemotaxis protein MotB